MVMALLEKLLEKECYEGQGDLVAQKILDFMAKEKVVVTPRIIDMFSIFRIVSFKMIPFVPGLVNYLIEHLINSCPKWSDSLEDLSLRGCTYLSDTALLKACKFEKLKNIDVSFCERLSDMGLIHLLGLKGLTSVDLRGCDLVTEVGLGVLKTMNLKMIMCHHEDSNPIDLF
uniref:Uncharacterized protein n=1 Tax=Paramoeba aestuarina TaxID=180227 RepID=A0A7S4NTU5_9EUKA|mmetsp:Transcript_26419/g.41115  ORF Transcript_26419/g.41115 Transcript_26419/m.41115 type:complete len:172 (+) Transcript_26419:3-518(+)